MVCGHGGHTKHIEEWFSDMDVCPSGCGCKCLEVMFGSLWCLLIIYALIFKSDLETVQIYENCDKDC